MDVGCQWGHTTLTLRNGKVLVFGGSEMTVQNCSVLIYDPDISKLSIYGEMCLPRENAAVAQVESNKVLLAGGYGTTDIFYQDPVNNRCLSESEIFDLETLQSEKIGKMTTARTGHTGTTLPNNKVLIAGGISSSMLSHPSVAQKSAEIYDHPKGSFSKISPMNIGRSDHTATFLDDGSVLIVGGHNGNFKALNSLELYDPKSNAFSVVGNLTTARYGHTATLLQNGYVLIVGGSGDSFKVLDSVEVCVPALRTFHLIESMSITRQHHTSTLLHDGSVLIAGGQDDTLNDLSSVELFIPSRTFKE